MEHSTTGRQPSEDRKSASVLTCQPQHFLQGSTARLVQLSPTLHRVTTCTTPYSDTMPQQSLVTPPGSSLITSCMAQSMMQCQHNMSEPGASNRVIDHYPKASHWLLLDVYNKSPRPGMATCVMPVTCCFLYQTLQSRCGFLWLQSMSITKSFPLFPLILLAPVSPVRHAERVQLIIVKCRVSYAERLWMNIYLLVHTVQVKQLFNEGQNKDETLLDTLKGISANF